MARIAVTRTDTEKLGSGFFLTLAVKNLYVEMAPPA
jgi:hypothetical protein